MHHMSVVSCEGKVGRILCVVPCVLACITILVSSVVLFGWFARSPLLVQVAPGLVAMQFNTALLFLLAAVSIILLKHDLRFYSALVSVMGLVISGSVFLQYLTGISTGIDTFIVQPTIAVEVEHPGRMGYNTSLAFILLFTSVGLHSSQLFKRFNEPLLASVVFTLGFVSVIGYLSDVSNLYGWGVSLSGMAVHTSICFVLLGAALFIVIRLRSEQSDLGRMVFITPVTAALPILCATFVVSNALKHVERNRVQHVLDRDSQLMSAFIGDELRLQEHTVERLVAFWQECRKDSDGVHVWGQYAQGVIDDFPSLNGLVLFSPERVPEYSVGDVDLIESIGGVAHLTQEVRSTANGSYQERFVRLGKSLGDLRYLLVVPLSSDLLDSAPPMIGLVMSPGVVFDRQRSWVGAQYEFIVEDPVGIKVREHAAEGFVAESDMTGFAVGFRDYEWTIHLKPTEAFYRAYTDAWPKASFLIGVLVAAGTCGLVYTLNSNRIYIRRQRELVHELTLMKDALDEHAIVAITDPEGRIIYANDAYCEISGYCFEELVGKTHSNQNSGMHPKEFFEGLWKTISSDQVWQGNICNRSKGGCLYWVSTTIVPFSTFDGQITHFVAISNDITRLVENEQKLEKANKKLVQSNEEMERFTYSVSHDLKSPLITIRGYLSCLREDIRNAAEERIERDINRIDHAAIGMGEIIHDLLELSRVGRIDQHPQYCDIQVLTREVIERLEGVVGDSEIDIQLDENMPEVWADPVRLKQLLQNLITNAIKYGKPESGVCRIRISAINEQDVVRLCVEDNGPGISPEHHEKIFELFQRLQADQEGSGIGLSIVKRIMETQGGSVWVDSEPGSGARFYLDFPIPQSSRIAA